MLKMKALLLYLILLVLVIFSFEQKSPNDGHETEMSIIVQAQSSECFYQMANAGDSLEIEYQVIDAGFGDMDVLQDLNINFHLHTPTDETQIISDVKQTDAAHRVDVKENGAFKFCFDNTYSHFIKKTVYFEVYVDAGDDDEKWEGFDFPPELLYNDSIDAIKMSVAKVHRDLNAIKHHQDQLRAIESRDRNLQEHNFTRVNHFSLFFILLMLIVGAIQVIMVKSLFDDNSKIHKFFKFVS